MAGFRTKIDYSDNRQIIQRERTNTVLTGATQFGVPFSALTSGPDPSNSGTTDLVTVVISTFSGNSGTTVYAFGDSRMDIGASSLSALTIANSGVTQDTGNVFVSSLSTVIDDNIVDLEFTGTSFDWETLFIEEVTPGNFTGSGVSQNVFVLSAGSLDFTGRTIWSDVKGISQTDKLIVKNGAVPGFVLTAIDTSGELEYTAVSGVTSGSPIFSGIWSAGTGTDSLVPINGNNVASATDALAFGDNTQATSARAHSHGWNTIASGGTSHAQGYNTIAGGFGSHAAGRGTFASSSYSTALGRDSVASGLASLAEGSSTASGAYSHAEGFQTVASGTNAHSEGMQTIAGGINGAHAEGRLTFASGTSSHAEGRSTEANGYASHAEGRLTKANGLNSHAEGNQSQANGYASHAEGRITNSVGVYSHAEGLQTIASGISSHSEGQYTQANGIGSHAEGNTTEANGIYSHSEGRYTLASGIHSHAEGDTTIASGASAHAEGRDTIAGGTQSHAEGFETTASGSYSHAEGFRTKAVGAQSHAGGYGGGGGYVIANAVGTFNHSHVTTGSYGAYGYFSAILGGTDNHIAAGATDSVIIGGSGNYIGSYARTTILGGLNIIAYASDVTYVPDLVIDGFGAVTDLQTNSAGLIINGASDITLKDNIISIDSALETILKLNPVSFEWVPEIKLREGTIYGLIAQEVQEVLPNIVTERAKGNGTLTLEYKEIIPWLIAAVKELAESGITENELIIETQTITSEDNNIELNYGGNHQSSLGGGIKVISAVADGQDSEIRVNSNGLWEVLPGLEAAILKIPELTPMSSDDEVGIVGELTRDDNYLYMKTESGWRRSNLEQF